MSTLIAIALGSVKRLLLSGYRAGRVRAIFKLPARLIHLYRHPLVYVELFDYFGQHPIEPSGLFTVTPKMSDKGYRACSVVPLSSVRLTCHLAPKYDSRELDYYLTAHSDSLQIFPRFLLNIFVSHPFYGLMRHWGHDGMWRSELPYEPPAPRLDDQDGDNYQAEGEDNGEDEMDVDREHAESDEEAEPAEEIESDEEDERGRRSTEVRRVQARGRGATRVRQGRAEPQAGSTRVSLSVETAPARGSRGAQSGRAARARRPRRARRG